MTSITAPMAFHAYLPIPRMENSMLEIANLEFYSDASGVKIDRTKFSNHFAVYIKVTDQDASIFRIGSAGTAGNPAATYRRFVEKDIIINPNNLSEKLNRWKSIWVLGIQNGTDGPIDNGFSAKRSLECYKALAIESFLIGQFSKRFRMIDQSIFKSKDPVADRDTFYSDLIKIADTFSDEIRQIVFC